MSSATQSEIRSVKALPGSTRAPLRILAKAATVSHEVEEAKPDGRGLPRAGVSMWDHQGERRLINNCSGPHSSHWSNANQYGVKIVVKKQINRSSGKCPVNGQQHQAREGCVVPRQVGKWWWKWLTMPPVPRRWQHLIK